MIIVVPSTSQAFQVDDFPAECPRSVKGALYLRPGTVEMTPEEWAHIKAKHPKLAAPLMEVPEPKKAEAKAISAVAEAAVESAKADEKPASHKKNK